MLFANFNKSFLKRGSGCMTYTMLSTLNISFTISLVLSVSCRKVQDSCCSTRLSSPFLTHNSIFNTGVSAGSVSPCN